MGENELMNLLITGAWKAASEQLESLALMGHTLLGMPDECGPVPCGCELVEGVICNGLFQFHSIEQFTSLRYIQLTSAGFDRVPMDYVTTHGIEIHNAHGVYSIPMAEFAVASVLQLYKKSSFFAENQKQRAWVKHRGVMELWGKTVCIVGCGNVGEECAKRFAAFGCRVIGVNRRRKSSPFFDNILPMDDLREAVAIADVVLVSVALAPETKGLFDTTVFSAMKDGCIFVNIARGAVLDTEPLRRELQTGRIRAVLDVFETEPLPENDPLWEMENVLITPHNSFVGEGNQERLWHVIAKNLELFR